jgi:hypothetical protein
MKQSKANFALYHCATVKVQFHMQLSAVDMHKAKRAPLLMEYQVSATVALPLLALLYHSFVC